MFSVTITDTASDLLSRMVQDSSSLEQRLVNQAAAVLEPFVQQNAPVGKHYTFSGTEIPGGNLRDNLHFTLGQYGAYLTGPSYGRFVITGTRPHKIMPRGAHSVVSTREEKGATAALAFYWAKVGRSVIAPYGVSHPGTKANDFRQTAIQQAFDTESILDMANRLLAEWVNGNG